jgi:hypothetical protein
MTSCDCDAWVKLEEQNRHLFHWDPSYGWVLSWVELTEEAGYTQVHRYGVPIVYCPMCGQKLITP